MLGNCIKLFRSFSRTSNFTSSKRLNHHHSQAWIISKEQTLFGMKHSTKILLFLFLFALLRWILNLLFFQELLSLPITNKKQECNRYENVEKTAVSPALNKKIKIDVYGGSITAGSGIHCNYNRFADIIGEEVKEVEVENKGMRGAGPQHWLHCGIKPVDVIVSEFRINERDPNVLEEWYMMTDKFAQHTVILDLWSWLTPPLSTSAEPATKLALHNLRKTFPHVNQTFSILSLSDRDKNIFREKIPSFFNYTGDDAIPEECYANVLGGGKDKNISTWCRHRHYSKMQHGLEPYHRDVASSLAKHIKEHVLPLVSLRQTPSLEPARVCIGSWGSGPGSRHQDSLPGEVSLDTLIVGETNFQISSPLSKREDKMTLNTNSISSKVRLDCPAPHNSMILGHIMHSDLEESGIFEVNGKNISTHNHDEHRPHIRIREYTKQSFKTPVDISVRSLRPGAYLELTDVVCKTEA